MNAYQMIVNLQMEIRALKRELAVLRSTEVADDMLTLHQRAEPDDPAENDAVIWLSSGSGTGDVGDLMIKITEGGATENDTIVDFSTL